MGVRKLAPKKFLKNFFQDNFYSLKAHAHYLTVFIYLETWRAAKLGIFTHFTFTNLPWYQGKFELKMMTQSNDAVKGWTYWCMYTLYGFTADHRRDHTSSYYRCPKKVSVLPPDRFSFLTLKSPPTRAGFPLSQGSQEIC